MLFADMRGKADSADQKFERASQTALPIGRRLRRARLERGLTLDQVASAVGLTKSFLSQLERDGTSASVASLQRICQVLGIRIAELLEPPSHSLLRHANRTPVSFGGEGVLDYILTPPDERRLQVFETHIAPGGSAGDELWTAEIDVDLILVLDGELEILFEDRSLTLAAGDALSFSPREPHTWRNPSATDEAVVVIASAPAGF